MTMRSAMSVTAATDLSTIRVATPLSRISRIVRQISSRMIGARPSVASSSMMSRGLAEQRAADRQHLLLAAGQLVAAIRPPLRQAREQLEHAFDVQRRCPLSPPRSAISRFSMTLRLAKMPRPSGT
jgi:hypothetical protein